MKTQKLLRNLDNKILGKWALMKTYRNRFLNLFAVTCLQTSSHPLMKQWLLWSEAATRIKKPQLLRSKLLITRLLLKYNSPSPPEEREWLLLPLTMELVVTIIEPRWRELLRSSLVNAIDSSTNQVTLLKWTTVKETKLRHRSLLMPTMLIVLSLLLTKISKKENVELTTRTIASLREEMLLLVLWTLRWLETTF